MNEIEEQIKKQAQFAEKLSWEKIPDDVRERAKWVILDSLGCVIKGCSGIKQNEKKTKEKADRIIDIAGAMISTELYEGNRKAIGHPACHIIPLLLVESAHTEMTYEEFMRIFVAAYEVAARWGRSIRFSHDVLGHGTVMTSGAAVAEGLICGMDAGEIYETLLLTESLPMVSVWQSVFDGSKLHDVYAGLSATMAIQSARMMKRGVRSTGKIVLDVYQKIMGADAVPEQLGEGLGEEYLLMSNYFKVHTGCRFVHPFADVMQKEMEAGLKKEDVEQIHVYTYKKAARLTDQTVPNDLAAKFSIPVSLAVQLIYGSLTPDTIRNCEKNEAVQKLSEHIWLHEDEEYNKLLPDVRGGRVEITKKDGSKITREVFHAVGDFDNPDAYTKDDLVRKFCENTKTVFDTEQAEQFAGKILNPGNNEKMESILKEFYSVIGG